MGDKKEQNQQRKAKKIHEISKGIGEDGGLTGQQPSVVQK